MAVEKLSLVEARGLCLQGLGFGARRTAGASGWSTMEPVIRHLGLLQIDSVNVLIRSHYLPLYSRLGKYNRSALDRRTLEMGHRQRSYFEYWGHEASLLPLEDWPLWTWKKEGNKRGRGLWGGLERLERDHPGFIDDVLVQVKERGPLAARDLEGGGKGKGSWWGWSAGKSALEHLFLVGEVTAAGRVNFERRYAAPEAVVPAEILAQPALSRMDAIRVLVGRAVKSYGVGTVADFADYYRLGKPVVGQVLRELEEAGTVVPVALDGWKNETWADAEALAASAPKLRPTALVSPFDPVVWFRRRAERLFDFRYRIGFYTPKEKREYGYNVLPFLMNGRFVGRVDLKADRQAGLLRVPGAFVEPGERAAPVKAALTHELARMADWLELDGVDWDGKLVAK